MTAGMYLPEAVSPEEWLAARKDLLVKEKEATRARDRVARTWSPVSRFTGHARSRHASQTLRRGLSASYLLGNSEGCKEPGLLETPARLSATASFFCRVLAR